MATNSKFFVMRGEVRETITVTRSRHIFRKLLCPKCGMDTGLFEREADKDLPPTHLLVCNKLHENLSRKEFNGGQK